MDETITIAGVKVYNGSFSSLLSAVGVLLKTKSNKSILTANPEIIVQSQDDTKLRQVLNNAWATIPDGVGILWAAKIQNKTVAERITGVRLTKELLEVAEKQKLTIGVIGGSEQASLKYREYLKRHVPNNWTLPGPWIDTTDYYETKNEVIDWLESVDGQEFLKKLEKTDILFVAMGAPKQEFFIDYLTHKPKIGNFLSVAVGGTFDELSGIAPKTPDIINNIGMKWFYRLVTEPWRFKRQTRLLHFIRLVTAST